MDFLAWLKRSMTAAFKIAVITFTMLISIELFVNLLQCISRYKTIGADQIHQVARKDYIDERRAPAQDYWNEYHPIPLVWSPYVYFKRAASSGKYINVSHSGIRKTWNIINNNNSDRATCKVWCFGGSTMWGDGARDDFTIPSYISKILAESQTQIRFHVRNFGEVAYVSTQELLALYLCLREGNRPDIVIFYDGVNDTYSAFQAKSAGIPLNEYEREADFKMGKRYRRYTREKSRLALLFLQSTETYRLAQALVARVKGPAIERHMVEGDRKIVSDLELHELAENMWNSYVFNVSTIKTICKLFGIDTLFYWQPVAYVHPSPPKKELDEAPTLAKFYSMTYDFARKHASIDYRFLGSVLDDFPSSEIYIDHCHVTETGNKIVAKAIVPDILVKATRRY